MAYTSFFRDADVLDAIAAHVVPWAAGLAEIRIWDAGCATGEETYSLAMIFAERMDPFALRNVRILATDREESRFPQFEARLREGRYHRRDLVWVPEELRSTWFSPADEADQFEVVPALKACIQYQRHDLLALEPPGDGFALVVCKNVLMHCPEPMQGPIVRMFHAALRSGGFLALDAFQALPEAYREAFEPVEPGVQLFRKREGAP